MTYFLHQPAGIFLRSNDELLSVGKELPVGTYVVAVTPGSEYYLTKVDNFTRPKKTYGTVNTKAAHIMATFKDRDSSTGVLLSGEQGSGKTMLARELSLLCAEQGISTIIVNTPFCGANFNQFIQQINVPAIVIFDEFEKMYDDDSQEKMLTLLDGLFPSKKLFVLTCNNLYRIDQHLLNRPGRLFYHLKYNGLEMEFISEYVDDLLINKENAEGLLHISRHFHTFNFDMLKALVEEMNRFGTTAAEAVEMLNVSPNDSKEFHHTAHIMVNGETISESEEWHGNPLDGSDVQIRCYYDKDDGDGNALPINSDAVKNDRSNSKQFMFTMDDLCKIDGQHFTFVKGNTQMVLSRVTPKKFQYASF